jgi:RNA polymerase sigma-70 factor (ECF subfamily)
MNTYSEADDIIQDVALKIFERPDNLSPVKNVAAFVFKAVRNKIIDIMRSSKKDFFPEAILNDFALESTSDLDDNSNDTYNNEEIRNALYNAIHSLKPKYKEIIIAIDFEGKSYKKLSKQMNVPIGTLLNRHHRALSVLTKQLEQFKLKY